MSNTFINQIKGYALAVMSLFSKKKRVTAILSPNIEAATTKPSISVSRSTVRHSTAPFARLNNITAMLDQEAMELYGRGGDNPHGKRNPYVMD